MLVHNITIMKYRIGNEYYFKVLDKFDEPDEVRRLDMMIAYGDKLASKYSTDYEQLWVKNSVII